MAKVVLDQTKCIGCGACVASCGVDNGGNFDFDEETRLAKVVNDTPVEATKGAVEGCPVEAISIQE